MAHRLSIARVKFALEQCGGIRAAAARTLKVSRTTLWRYIGRHPALQDYLAEIDEEVLDLAEGKVLQAVRAGDMKTVMWFLECKGKDRGYTRRVEATGKDGAPVEVRQTIDLSKLTLEELEILQRVVEQQDGSAGSIHNVDPETCDCSHCKRRRRRSPATTSRSDGQAIQ